MNIPYWQQRRSLTPQQAMQLLRDGNSRFTNNLSVNRNHLDLINATADQQAPFATMLSCSDSRVCPELIFDLGIGDIFNIKLAGNIASSNAIGSMEYSFKVLGSKLLIVMGHTNCGAIRGACDNVQMDHLNPILDHIRPAIEAEKTVMENRNSHNHEFINKVAWLNVQHNIDIILNSSAIIKNLALQQDVIVAGAMYRVETGKAEFFIPSKTKTLNDEKIYSNAW